MGSFMILDFGQAQLLLRFPTHYIPRNHNILYFVSNVFLSKFVAVTFLDSSLGLLLQHFCFCFLT